MLYRVAICICKPTGAIFPFVTGHNFPLLMRWKQKVFLQLNYQQCSLRCGCVMLVSAGTALSF